MWKHLWIHGQDNEHSASKKVCILGNRWCGAKSQDESAKIKAFQSCDGERVS